MTPTDPRVAFASALSAAMREGKWTQRRVADAAGVSQQTVSGWLRGKTIPDIGTIEQLAEALGADPEAWLALKLEALRGTEKRRTNGPTASHSRLEHAVDVARSVDSDLDALALASGLDPRSLSEAEKAMLRTVFAGIRASRAT